MTDASNGKRDFFISFNQADRAWATWIAWVLEEAGYSVFFQDWDFKGNFVLEMDRAHKLSRRTVAILSPDYLASRFTAPEWAARFAQDATGEHDLLIPVRVRPCELQGLLAQIVYLDLVGCGELETRKKLLDRVANIRLKPDEPPLFPGGAGHEAVPKKPNFPTADHGRPRQTPLEVEIEITREIGGQLSTLNVRLCDLLVAPHGIARLLDDYENEQRYELWRAIKSRAHSNHEKLKCLYAALDKLEGTKFFGKYPRVRNDIGRVIDAKMHDFYFVLSQYPESRKLTNREAIASLRKLAHDMEQYNGEVEKSQDAIAAYIMENEAYLRGLVKAQPNA